MRRFLLSAGLLLSGLLTPVAAAAYVSPEQMLSEGDFSTRFLAPPPSSPREYERVAAQQQAESLARQEENMRQLILNARQEQAVAQEESGTVHAAAESEPGREKTVTAGDDTKAAAGGTTTNARDARILERVYAQQEESRLRAQLQWLTQTQSLHGGAPLMSDTGPATIGAALLLVATGAWMLRRVKRMERVR